MASAQRQLELRHVKNRVDCGMWGQIQPVSHGTNAVGDTEGSEEAEGELLVGPWS
jgi:hypothetical protein